MRPRSKIAAMRECRRVGKVLQAYLDGQTDERTTRQIAVHLEACRRCGFEADTYRELTDSLRRRGAPIDEITLARLRAFAGTIAAEPRTPGPEDG